MASTTSNGYYLEHVLDANGGTITLNAEEPFVYHRLSGTATLVSSWSVAGSNLGTGQRFVIHSEAVLTLGANTLTILGVSIPQSIANIPFTVEGIYNGSGWDTTVSPSFQGLPVISTDMLESDSVTTAKILDANVTVDKLASNSVSTIKILDDNITTAKILNSNVTLAKLESALKVETLVVPVSFETGEQCNNTFIIPFACTITSVSASVVKALSGTDDGTITLEIAGSPSTPSLITIPASSPLNTVVAIVPASNNAVAAGDTISLISTKTTVAGKALVSIKLIRA